MNPNESNALSALPLPIEPDSCAFVGREAACTRGTSGGAFVSEPAVVVHVCKLTFVEPSPLGLYARESPFGVARCWFPHDGLLYSSTSIMTMQEPARQASPVEVALLLFSVLNSEMLLSAACCIACTSRAMRRA